MHITIDTNNITEQDRAVLAFVLSGANAQAAEQAAVIADHRERVEAYEQTKSTNAVQDETPAEPEKPKRTRRTKAQIAAEAQEVSAPDDEPTPDSENAESAREIDNSPDTASIEQVTELATRLIQKDRSAMVDLLKQFGARRVSEIPESDLGTFAAEIRAKLA